MVSEDRGRRESSDSEGAPSSSADGTPDQKRHRRIEEFFHAVRELPPGERAAFLDRECTGHPELRADVEALLEEDQAPVIRSSGPGESSVETVDVPGPEDESDDDPERKRLPERIGPYKILGVLGQGGMGVVYLAEQREPIRRRVALKCMTRTGHKEFLARFESERNALAMMNHPHIARVYEAGATDDGQPYFAMEHVQGVPITDYCDQHKLGIPERLRLFLQICQGLEHAHHRGVIHRDIKPSNILVTVPDEDPIAKIIDFGVAKATNQRLTEKTLYTEVGRVIGTPQYMSPEQAKTTGEDVDHRTDIYSLGVLLYELLVGQVPLDLDVFSVAFDEIVRRIREEEPLPPSTRLSQLNIERTTTLASSRGTNPPTLRGELRGNLDWITMKALEKERIRRYRTASELGADVERHLRGELAEAGPPSAMYRLRKYVRRHRGPVVAAGAVILTLVAGLVASLVLYFDSAEKERAAVTANRDAVQAAREARGQATLARIRLDAVKRREEQLDQESYVHRIRLAEREYENRMTGRAKELLRSCEPEMRGWEWNRLQWLTDRSTATIEGGRRLGQLLPSRDGKTIAAVVDKVLKLWDAENGRTLWSIDKRGGPHGTLWAFSADGKRILTRRTIGGGDAAEIVVEVLDAADGERIESFTIGDGNKLMFEAFGSPFAFTDGWNIWVLEDGKPGATKISPERYVHSPVFPAAHGPHRLRFVSTGNSQNRKNTLVDWSLRSQAEVRSVDLEPFVGRHSIGPTLSRDGSLLAIYTWEPEHRLQMLQIEEGEAPQPLSELWSREGVIDWAFSPNGATIATSYPYGVIRILDALTGAETLALPGHTERALLAFAADGQHLVSKSNQLKSSPQGHFVKVWNLDDADEDLLAGEAPLSSSVLDTPHDQVLSGHEDGTVHQWTKNEGRWRPSRTIKAQTGKVSCLAVSADGRRAAAAANHRREVREEGGESWEVFATAVVWEIDTGAPVGKLRFDEPNRRYIDDLKLNADGSTVLVMLVIDRGKEEFRLEVWNISAQKAIAEIPDLANGLVTAPDGSCFAVFRNPRFDVSVHVFESGSGDELFRLPYDSSFMAFNADGRQLAIQSPGMFTLHDTRDGRAVENIAAKVAEGRFVFDAPGRRVASIDGESIHVRDAKTGEGLTVCRGHEARVSRLAFGPSDPDAARGPSRLVSAGEDGTVKLWDPARGHELLTLHGRGPPVTEVAFSADGREILAVNVRGVHVWRAPDAPPEAEVVGPGRSTLWGGLDLHGKLAASAVWRTSVEDASEYGILFWDTASGQERLELRGYSEDFPCVRFDKDGSRLVAGANDGAIYFWNVVTGEELMVLRDDYESPLHLVRVSPDGLIVAGGYFGRGRITLWNTVTGEKLRDIGDRETWSISRLKLLGIPVGASPVRVTGLEAHPSLQALAFDPRGERLASYGRHAFGKPSDGRRPLETRLKVWDVRTGDKLLDLRDGEVVLLPQSMVFGSRAFDIVFTPDGDRILLAAHRVSVAQGNGDFELTLTTWDAATGKKLGEMLTLKHYDYKEWAQNILPVTFRSDGRQLAAAHTRSARGAGDWRVGDLTVWDTQTKQPIWSHEARFGVKGLALGSDGRIAYYDGTGRFRVRQVSPAR